jgi:hypothetical protein
VSIVYEGRITKLKQELERWLKWMIENPSEKLARVELNLKLYIDGTEISQENIQKFKLKNTGKNLTGMQPTLELYELTINVHNPTQRIYHKGNSSIAIITSSRFPRSTNTFSTSLMPGDRYIQNLPSIETLFPGAWQSMSLQLGAMPGFVSENVIVRLFTEIASLDFAAEVYNDR